MIKNIFSLLTLITFQCHLQSVVILVHGSLAIDEKWCRPGGEFYEALEKEATALGHKLLPFAWSGKLNIKARRQGAEALAKTILSYPINETLILIGHSHGGNVINFASQLLNDPVEKLMKDYSPEKLHKEITELINKAYNEICVNRKSVPFIEKEYLIDVVYLIGTPIDTKNYPPDMSTIKELFNLYSDGDTVQTVLGFYKRLLPPHDRCANFQVLLKNSKGSNLHPSHFQLHNPLIAKWLLKIPHKLSEEKIGNFEKFSLEQNGKILFRENEIPLYENSITFS